jgi:hypothetical protein
MKKQINQCIEVGFVVLVVTKPGTAPRICYCGEVQELDSLGMRITSVNWLSGTFTCFDLFFRWESITSVLVATSAHDKSEFGKLAAMWQEKMEDKQKKKTN